MDYSLITSRMVWSYSRIKAFKNCKYSFLLRYIYNEPQTSNFYAQVGIVVHSVLQSYLCGHISKEQLTVYFSKEYLSKVTEKPNSSKLYFLTFSELIKYFENPNLNFIKRVLGVEKRVGFNIGENTFTGFIDLVCETKEGIAVVDHKSKVLKPRTNKSNPTKTGKELDEYLYQLYLYSIPVKEQHGEFPKRLIFNCFKENTIISEPFDYDKFVSVKKWAVASIEEINREREWEPNIDYFFCNNLCDVRDSCEYRQFKT